MDREVALEALGVLCNARVTSVQRQKTADGSQAASQGISEAAAPSLLTVNQLIHKVLDGDAVRQTVGSTITHPFQDSQRPTPGFPTRETGGQVGGTPICALSIDTKVDSKGNLELIVDEDEFFEPGFDYDFTNVTDFWTYYRGGEVYERPCGWKRFAIKVLGKYDEDTWLGNNCRITQSVEGEWPVSYHGTSMKGAEGIIEERYKPGSGQAYGRGIYSTPYISETKPYIKTFQSEKTGKRYQVLLQNRINPEYRKIHNKGKYWLVEIPEGKSEKEEKEIVDRAIRPYGLLLREEGACQVL